MCGRGHFAYAFAALHAEYPVICPFLSLPFFAQGWQVRACTRNRSALRARTQILLRDDLRSIYFFIANLSTSMLKAFQVCIARAVVSPGELVPCT